MLIRVIEKKKGYNDFPESYDIRRHYFTITTNTIAMGHFTGFNYLRRIGVPFFASIMSKMPFQVGFYLRDKF